MGNIFLHISAEIAHRWLPRGSINDGSPLAQIIGLYIGNNPFHGWLGSRIPYGLTRPEWIKACMCVVIAAHHGFTLPFCQCLMIFQLHFQLCSFWLRFTFLCRKLYYSIAMNFAIDSIHNHDNHAPIETQCPPFLSNANIMWAVPLKESIYYIYAL